MRKEYVPIILRVEEAKQIEEYIKSEKRFEGRTFSNAAKTILLEYIEFNKQLKRYGPFLKFIGAEGNLVFIYDHFIDRIVEVEVREKKMYCRHCESENCIHIGFCFAVPELYSVLSERGFKEPK
ncbi:MAG: hypothetical protein ACK4FV_07500 [Candidatus Nitrosocaldus sp.]